MPKSPTASKREVRTALAVASNTGQALNECVEAIQRLAQTGEGLAEIVGKLKDASERHEEYIGLINRRSEDQGRRLAIYERRFAAYRAEGEKRWRGIGGRLLWLLFGQRKSLDS